MKRITLLSMMATLLGICFVGSVQPVPREGYDEGERYSTASAEEYYPRENMRESK